MAIRIDVSGERARGEDYERARAALADLKRARHGATYLGMRARTLAAIAAAFVAFVATASLILQATNYGAPCISDDGAPCITEAEYADVLVRLDVIRSERSGDRFNEGSR